MQPLSAVASRDWLSPVVLAVAVAVYAAVFLQTPRSWWFEDDCNIAAVVADVRNPATFFTPAGLPLGIIGTQPVPFLNLTFWIDHAVAPRDPFVAYVHSAVSIWLAAVLLQSVLTFWIGRVRALGVALLWLLLPGTVVMAEWVSARHFLEGFVFSLLAVRLALASESATTRWRTVACTAGAAGAYLAASLCKQLWVSTTLVCLGWLMWRRRNWLGLGLLSAAAAAYVGFWLWTIGASNPYGIPLLTGLDYLLFLGRYPYIFSGGPEGYVVLLLWVWAVGFGWWNGRVRVAHLALATGLLVVAFATVYPASFPLSGGYDGFGTWYRIAFLPSTLLLVLGGGLLVEAGPRAAVAVVATAAVVALGLGATRTSHAWDTSKATYRLEGEFYLKHQDRLLYSKTPAWWFLEGVHELHADVAGDRHYILSSREKWPGNRLLLELNPSIWQRSADSALGIVEDRELYDYLKANVTE